MMNKNVNGNEMGNGNVFAQGAGAQYNNGGSNMMVQNQGMINPVVQNQMQTGNSELANYMRYMDGVCQEKERREAELADLKEKLDDADAEYDTHGMTWVLKGITGVVGLYVVSSLITSPWHIWEVQEKPFARF